MIVKIKNIVVNTDNGRACSEEPFGIACYAGSYFEGKYQGDHQGVVGTAQDADSWLAGRSPERLIPIFTDGRS